MGWKRIENTKKELGAALVSVRMDADGTYACRIRMEADGAFSIYIPDEEPDEIPTDSPTRREYNGQPIGVSLGHCLIDMDSRKAYYRSPEDFLEARKNFATALDDGTQVPIQVLGSGQVLVTTKSNQTGKAIHVSNSHRKILHLLQEGHGECSRLAAMNEVISVEKQMNMTSPERTMYEQIRLLNKTLEPFGLFIDTDKRNYNLKMV